jgi:catechol 2,3-dioxygenase-like lactoylglutathione lyase family enzyme
MMGAPDTHPVRMGLEVIVIPVSDADRSKAFYTGLGWRLDADIAKGRAFRLMQFTPPGSACSIHFGAGLTSAPPGSAGALYLIVADIQAAHDDLRRRGVDVSEVFHRSPGEEYASGADPQHRSYRSYVSFKDPDGNTWVVQEITTRLPGRQES